MSNIVEKYCDFREQLNKFDLVAFVPKGNSMYPFIRNKAQTVFISKKVGKLMPFDIAMFERENGAVVLHRVLEVQGEKYLFCGDSQFYFEWVNEDKVVGVLTAFQKGKKTVLFTDKHRKKAEKWYRNKTWRKIRTKFYFFRVNVKAKLKRIFNREG